MPPPFTLLSLANQCPLQCSCVEHSSRPASTSPIWCPSNLGPLRLAAPLMPHRNIHTLLITYALQSALEPSTLPPPPPLAAVPLYWSATVAGQLFGKLVGSVVQCNTVPGSWQDQLERFYVAAHRQGLPRRLTVQAWPPSSGLPA